MVMLSANFGASALFFLALIIVGFLILGLNLWLLGVLGRILALPRTHAKAAWWLININLLESIITACWLVGLILIKKYQFTQSLKIITEVLWSPYYYYGTPQQHNSEMIRYCLTFYWPMLVCLIAVPMIGLVHSNALTRQTARLSLKYGFLRIYGVYIGFIAVQMPTYFPILFGSFGLSIYSYRKMYQHAKTVLKHPNQAVIFQNQQLMIAPLTPETDHHPSNKA